MCYRVPGMALLIGVLPGCTTRYIDYTSYPTDRTASFVVHKRASERPVEITLSWSVDRKGIERLRKVQLHDAHRSYTLDVGPFGLPSKKLHVTSALDGVLEYSGVATSED